MIMGSGGGYTSCIGLILANYLEFFTVGNLVLRHACCSIVAGHFFYSSDLVLVRRG